LSHSGTLSSVMSQQQQLLHTPQHSFLGRPLGLIQETSSGEMAARGSLGATATAGGMPEAFELSLRVTGSLGGATDGAVGPHSPTLNATHRCVCVCVSIL
jgi:hypothetical protein